MGYDSVTFNAMPFFFLCEYIMFWSKAWWDMIMQLTIYSMDIKQMEQHMIEWAGRKSSAWKLMTRRLNCMTVLQKVHNTAYMAVHEIWILCTVTEVKCQWQCWWCIVVQWTYIQPAARLVGSLWVWSTEAQTVSYAQCFWTHSKGWRYHIVQFTLLSL